MPFLDLTPAQASDALAGMGIVVAPGALQIEPRDERWVVRLPHDRLAWFAASPAGRTRLATERRILRVLEARCAFRAPRVLHEDADGDVDVRAMVPGLVDPWRLFEALGHDAGLATRIGTAVGVMLADQHTNVRHGDVAGWLNDRPAWPPPAGELLARLPQAVGDARLLERMAAVLAAYEAVDVAQADRVLVHCDVGLHNLAVDAESHAVQGLFDYDGAAWADRHHDFRYLVFHRVHDRLLDAALAAYEPAVGVAVSRERLMLYNAACAIAFLAHRAGTRPDERPCGRSLAEDLEWTRLAVGRALVT